MRLRSWLSTCSSSTCTTTAQDSTIPFPKNLTQTLNLLASDTTSSSSSSSSSSDIPSSATSSSNSSTSASTLQSLLSLQTLPSVPTLQKISPESLSSSVSYLSVASIKPSPSLPITCVAVHGNLLYACSSHEINVYDSTTSAHLDAFNGQDPSSGSVKAVTFCDDKVFTTHQDCKIRVWQAPATKSHKLLATLPTFNDRLRRSVLPKNYVTVRRHKKRLWIEHADAVTGLAVNNGLIYSVSWDKSLKIWRASDLRCIESVTAHEDAVNAVAVSADGTVYTGSADRRIRVWAKLFGEKRHALIATLEKHKSAVNALALNGDGSILFSGACDRSILVWEGEERANHMVVTGALRGHDKAVLCLVNVSDMLFSGSADRTVRMWQRRIDGRYCCLAVLEGLEKPVKSLAAVSEEGESNGVVYVFGGGLDGEIKAWRVSVSNVSSPI